MHERAAPRAQLTGRAIEWAVGQPRTHDIAAYSSGRDARGRLEHHVGGYRSGHRDLSGPPRSVGQGYRPWDLRARLARRGSAGDRAGHRDRGPIRDAHGRPRAHLLDLEPVRTAAAYGDGLAEQGKAFTARICTTTLDPFQSYANAIRTELLEPFPPNFGNYRIRGLLAASGRRPWRKYLITLNCEERLITIIVTLAIYMAGVSVTYFSVCLSDTK